MTQATSLYGPVAPDLAAVDDRLRGLAAGHDPLLVDALSHVLRSGGKRIRPGLVLLSGRLGHYHLDRLVTFAAAVEVVHTATLVHDDTVDQSTTRRGSSTVNAMWDGKVAILLGDYLFAQSAQLAAHLDDVRLMNLLSETVMAMSRAELRQYESSRDRRIDESDYLLRIAGKTASLFAMCSEGAGIISEQSEDHIAALRRYGTSLGMAFQIADDVLDFMGDEGTLGKPAGNDLRQGTITLPAILLAKQLPESSALRRDLERGTNLEAVVEAVQESSGVDRALQAAERYAAEAREALVDFPQGEVRDTLIDLTEHVVHRRA